MMRADGRPRLLRPWSVTAAALTTAHHGFELANGIGLVLQPELGLPGSGTLWGVQLPLWAAIAGRGGPRWDRVVAVSSGAALAGVAVHFALWPLRRSRLGVPVLASAEGLDARGLAVYNAILYAWGTASVLSVALEVPRGRRRWALLGLATFPLQRASAAHHFEWLKGAAARRPAWWNRAGASA